MNVVLTIVLAFLSSIFIGCSPERSTAPTPLHRYISGFQGDLSRLIDEAPDHATLVFVPAEVYTVRKAIIINKPLTIRGLSAKIPAKLAIHAIIVQHEGVTIDQVKLLGNAGTIGEDKRKALLSVQKGHFLIENSSFVNSSKDGIEVSNPDTSAIEHGVIRNIIGRGNLRDLVSINGENDGRIHHLQVENIRCYNSPQRGAVEVSDGTENITVRKVWADSCIYAVDVQDHGYPDVVNHDILIENIIAKNCRHAIRTANSDIGHARHTFRDITAIHCEEPLRISNIRNLYMDNITISGQTKDTDAFAVKNCENVTISNVVFEGISSGESGLSLLNCDHVYIDHVQVAGPCDMDHGIAFEIDDGKAYSTLMIVHAAIRGTRGAGIFLRARNGCTLAERIVEGNLSTIEDDLN